MKLRQKLADIAKELESNNVPFIILYNDPENNDTILSASGHPKDIGLMLYSAMETHETFSDIIKGTASAAQKLDGIFGK